MIHLRLDDIDLEKVKGANLFHFGYPSLMRKMYIDGGKELVRLSEGCS
ncbi:MAG: hypothetical protein ACLR6B_13035 [Blautia sp.]